MGDINPALRTSFLADLPADFAEQVAAMHARARDLAGPIGQLARDVYSIGRILNDTLGDGEDDHFYNVAADLSGWDDLYSLVHGLGCEILAGVSDNSSAGAPRWWRDAEASLHEPPP